MDSTGNTTINDVARLAGVSKKTVSRVINKSPLLSDKTRAQVEAVIDKIGYVPNPQARALALRRNFIVAAIHDNPNAQFLVNVQQGILDALNNTEFDLMVHPVDRSAPDLLDNIKKFLERQRPYGVVLLPPISENEDIIALCKRIGVRYCRMCSANLDTPEHMVLSNDRQAVREATEYLIAQGHRRIGLICGPEGFLSPTERRAGFEEALAAAGIELSAKLIAPGDYTFESGVKAGLSLLDRDHRPTAIFASNDQMAIGTMIAARRRGIDIPRDLSIVGFDDTPLSEHVWPSLTTVRWPIVAMGRAAAAKLIRSDDAKDDAPASRFLSTLVTRASVAPPPTQ
ncbi:MAG: LacI family DNA-binding transcriptional regulator [Pacificimonas sp.]